MNQSKSIKKMTMLTMLTAMAILLHSIEPSVPIPIPGVKFGLANSVALITLYLFDAKAMIKLNIVRVILSSLIRGILFGIGFWLSVAGVVLSSIVMIVGLKLTKMSPVGVSLAGAYAHNIGQIVALIIINKTWGMVYWLPIMLVASIPTGLITGYLALLILIRFKVSQVLLRHK